MGVDSVVLQEQEYPTRLNWDLLEQWASMPLYSENDPSNPEWKQTPVVEAELPLYNLVHIKNEAVNPTGTVKDRAAWECATKYRDLGRWYLQLKKEGALNGNIGRLHVPRMSILTAGSMGRALSQTFKKYGLPPQNLLVDINQPHDQLDELYADIVAVDFSQELTPQDIQRLTRNLRGVELTSVTVLEPQAVFYDWLAHEVFNEEPDEIYAPYGSGRLIENLLTWQHRTYHNAVRGTPDPRLQANPSKVIKMNIYGAEPHRVKTSIADKLTKNFHPFALFADHDITALKALASTGRHTGVYKVSEDKIKEAERIMNQHVPAEASGAAGLALYLQRYERGLVEPDKKVLIINTGKGT